MNAAKQVRNVIRAKVGLREIAQAADVSIATVSRVLNGNNRVDPAIQQVVLQAAAKLNVDPSSRNKTKALAFVLSNRAMLHAFHSRVLQGAKDAARLTAGTSFFCRSIIPRMSLGTSSTCPRSCNGVT